MNADYIAERFFWLALGIAIGIATMRYLVGC